MNIQGICRVCNRNKCDNKGKAYGYRSTCKRCYRNNLLEKKSVCERCSFIPEHPCQLDIHHIDHNHFNNDLSNLKTLCANCHRLEHV